eukprot:COSAG02_NODE_4866_length_4884_cov_2782.941902_6_plen_185_part_00
MGTYRPELLAPRWSRSSLARPATRSTLTRPATHRCLTQQVLRQPAPAGPSCASFSCCSASQWYVSTGGSQGQRRPVAELYAWLACLLASATVGSSLRFFFFFFFSSSGISQLVDLYTLKLLEIPPSPPAVPRPAVWSERQVLPVAAVNGGRCGRRPIERSSDSPSGRGPANERYKYSQGPPVGN